MPKEGWPPALLPALFVKWEKEKVVACMPAQRNPCVWVASQQQQPPKSNTKLGNLGFVNCICLDGSVGVVVV